MKIKEVEECVGLTRSNIRFYEREGLLLPDRNENNNYRDYTEEDVERIRKIKHLRMLGVTTADIRKLYSDELKLDDVLKECMQRMKEEEKELQEMQKVCESIIDSEKDIYTWDGELTHNEKLNWSARLEKIFSQDTFYEPLSRKEFNKNIAKMLGWVYLVNAVFTLILWPFFKNYQGFAGGEVLPMYRTYGEMMGGTIDLFTYSVQHKDVLVLFVICVILVNVCTIVAYLSQNVRNQTLFFSINAVLMAPILISLVKMYEDAVIIIKRLEVLSNTIFTGFHLCLFWVLIVLYVAVLYLLSQTYDVMFREIRYTVIAASLFTVLYGGIFYFISGKWLAPGAAFAMMLFYIGLNWTSVNMDCTKYNRLDVVVTTGRIMNPFSMFLHV